MTSKEYLKAVSIPDTNEFSVILTTDADTMRVMAYLEGVLAMIKKIQKEELLEKFHLQESVIVEMTEIIDKVSKNQEGPGIVELLREISSTI